MKPHEHKDKPWCRCGYVWCEACQAYFSQKPGEGDHARHVFPDDEGLATELEDA